MNKTVKKINTDQLAEMVANITKQYIRESYDLNYNWMDPETGEDEYEEAQGVFKDNPGTPMDKNPDDEFYDDFLSNPAENSFQSDEDTSMDDDSDLDSLLESKEKKMLSDRQDELLNFITENWNNHANNLIK